jgi:hypothetical protein
MQYLLNPFFWFLIFIISLFCIFIEKNRTKNLVHGQFVITGTLLLIFYIIGIISGICTILNFIINWFFIW